MHLVSPLDVPGRLQLRAPSVVPGGMMRVRLPRSCDLAAEVRRLLVAKGLIAGEVNLAALHASVPPESQAPDRDELNAITKAFYETDAAFADAYLGIIRHVARHVLAFEFLYQATPTVRFHFPVRFRESYRAADGAYLGHHNDGMLGHSLDEINCWLPLTDCQGSAALQLAPLDDSIRLLEEFCTGFAGDAATFHAGRLKFVDRLLRDREFRAAAERATRPVPMKYGELLIFDARCIHATSENVEGTTRVSADFRVIPLEKYERLAQNYASAGRSRRKFVRGDVFAQASSAGLLRRRLGASP